MKVKRLKVGVSRTIQIVQFHPVSITVEEDIEIEPGDVVKDIREEAYKRCSVAVTKYLKNEERQFEKE